MLKLRDGVVELYRKVATSIPNDVEEALKKAYENETNQISRTALEIILKNISFARTSSRPICQDTGFPVFYVKTPRGLSQSLIMEVINDATRIATRKIPLRTNAIDTLTDNNTGDNTGFLFPLIHIDETEEEHFNVELLLLGGGSENIGQTYKLPALINIDGKEFIAERNLEGARKCIFDAIFKAQGKACPPYYIGVAVGGSKEQTAFLSKRQLMRRINDENPIAELNTFEKDLLQEINRIGIGVAGFGGNNTAMGLKIALAARHPASYIVDISFSCWAMRRGRLIW
ncbi:MAG TPA: fumarate hydratase [Nitrospirae bacterium]|nr:fumarate hydratase [Nitrospirota bacterium]